MVMEARAQARLQHPHVLTIHYIGRHQGAPFFAMEYVHGLTLADRLDAHGPLPWAEALEYAIQTASALAAAHRQGIVHRDIKPSNLILEPGDRQSAQDGLAPGNVKVADFGLATAVGTREKHFVGSPQYAAPELVSGGRPDLRSDIYALGVTLFELLSGRPPFQSDTMPGLFDMHRSAPRPPVPEDRAPWRLRKLVGEMLSVDPIDRPQSHEALMMRLKTLRPTRREAGGFIARGLAFAVDLTSLAVLTQAVASLPNVDQRSANPIGLALFAFYYVVAHRIWGKTLGKKLMGLRIGGSRKAVRVPRLVLRFLVQFWGPILALGMVSLQVGAVTDLQAVKHQISQAVGIKQIAVLDDSMAALLRTLIVPNLFVALPWIGGFFFALVDRNRQALHDKVASTLVEFRRGSKEAQ